MSLAIRSLSLAIRSLPLSLLAYLTVSTVVRADSGPIEVEWSDNTYGPDGPWRAVEVTVGDSQKIALYPGHEFQSYLLTSDYCTHNTTPACYASSGGLYNTAQSEVDNTGSTGQIQFAPEPGFMLGVDMAGDDATSWIDYMEVGDVTVPNVSLALVDASYSVYPDGTWMPLTLGCLGLGAPKTVNQSFSTNGGPPINASLIPGYLNSQGTIASNSFGMHIGAVNPSMPGSLYFGGYDQNRIVGDILTESDDYNKQISLKDISINVIDGSSPWDFDSKAGLLASGNDTIGSGGIKVSVDGCSPYLTLPKSTCDAITANLPVTYNAMLGLYTWNTDDAKYSQIVNSASALQFTFFGSSNTDTVNISVPFRHLNLTLSAPLVDEDQQYFPCYTGPSGQFTLGRAFLQDAFVGASWGTKTWWLAQAPGPNIPAASVVELESGATEIKASSNDWKESWSGSWKALTPEDVSSGATVTAPGTDASTTSSSSSGLSTGAQAGIGVGAGIAGLAIIGAIAFFFMRRRKARQTDIAAAVGGTVNNNTPQHGYYEPVKNPYTGQPSPNPSNGMAYGQPYPQQQYPHPQYGQPQYSAELPAVGNTPMELPGSSPTFNSPHTSYASPQPSHANTHSPPHEVQ
ncbi:acid protease [Xylariaceae sp. FL0016]|nr:acid protease [Xylariaceae sp. FL0016]